MLEKKKYFVVREKAVPEVLLKVVEAKRLLDTKRVGTLTISVEVLAETGDISKMIETIESREGIQYLKILARE